MCPGIVMAEMDMEGGARESGTEKAEGWSWGPEGQGWAVAFGKGCAPTGTHGQLFFFFFFKTMESQMLSLWNRISSTELWAPLTNCPCSSDM